MLCACSEGADDTVEDDTDAQEENAVDEVAEVADENVDEELEKTVSQDEFVEPISGSLPSSSSGAPEYFEAEAEMTTSLLPEKGAAPETNDMSMLNSGNEMPLTTASRRESVGSNGSTPTDPSKPWGEDAVDLPEMAPERVVHAAVKVRKTKVPKRNVPAKKTLARKAPMKIGKNAPSTKRTSKVVSKSAAITVKAKTKKATQVRKTKNLKTIKKAAARKVAKRTGRSKTNAKITAKTKSMQKKSAKRVKKTIGKAKNISKARRA
eukprot:GHVT01033527.1.p1 GENE.GHVT01033527.1~~GHVT01033527.1.p1  ORF type:complete len:265 (+),score=52.06 GHVT01033527.1:2277-3071(+)